jgi:hypothetical protein
VCVCGCVGPREAERGALSRVAEGCRAYASSSTDRLLRVPRCTTGNRPYVFVPTCAT